MASAGVDQASLLADVFSTVLRKFSPASVAVIGCAGGNGFDRMDPRTTTRVVALDINPEYLAATERRYSKVFRQLVLHNADIARTELDLEPVDLGFAALLLEYVDVAAALRNLLSLCRQAGHLVVVLQLPSSALPAITATAVPTIMGLAAVIKLVDPLALEQAACRIGFALRESTRVTSSRGKQFAVHVYQRLPLEPPEAKVR
ncbi:MAG TPA: class I SAM-dependent methyltransferase [Steroidobacteraceae bacterium]